MDVEHTAGESRNLSQLYSWGRSDLGALLHADLEEHSVSEPVHLASKRTILQISSNMYHTAAVTTTGELYLCGSNDEGQVSEDGEQKLVLKPTLLESLQGHRVFMVACGMYHTACVTATGAVITFGGNEVGQLGHSRNTIQRVPPRMVEGMFGKVATHIACGELFTLMLTSNGELYSCGIGATNGHRHGRSTNRAEMVETLSGNSILFIAAGSHHALAYSATGRLYSWGTNTNGQLGVSGQDEGGGVQVPAVVNTHHLEGVVLGLSAGLSHSLVWTTAGKLYGCGSNKYGQLGGSSCPRLEQLEQIDIGYNSNCVSAACGYNHSLVLLSTDSPTPSTSVITFGSNGFGQCGQDSALTAVRSPYVLPALTDARVVSVFAGGDQSFAIAVDQSQSGTDAVMIRQYSVVASKVPTSLSAHNCLQILHGLSSKSDLSLVHDKVLPVFTSASLLGGSFLDPLMPLFLDVSGLESSYNALLHLGDSVVPKLVSALQSAVGEIEALGGAMSEGAARCLLMIWHCPLCAHVSLTDTVMSKLTTMLSTLTSALQIDITLAIRRYPAHLFAARLLSSLQAHLTNAASHYDPMSPSTESSNKLALYCNAASRLFIINAIAPPIVPLDTFYCPGLHNLNEHVLLVDYTRWKQTQAANGYAPTPGPNASQPSQFALCSYSFLLPAETKRGLLLVEASLQQQAAQQSELRAVYMSGGGYVMPFFVLHVSREHVLRHTLHIVSRCSDLDLKKPLKVSFANEEGVDEGGVKKEFFQLLTQQLFDLQFGMFVLVNDERFLWFNKDCTWSPEEYRLVGVLIGLAVYNGVILDVHLPRALYKKLLRHGVCLEDLHDLDPGLHKGLQDLLKYSPAEDVEDVFCRTFQVTWDDFGMTRTYDLIPDGGNVAVNAQNRELYVEKYVQWVLNQSISTQFAEFYSGFSRVVHPGTTSLFRADELELLVTGTSHLNFKELEASTEYVGGEGWDKNHPTVVNFWKVVHSLDFAQQQRFLMFCTGSVKAPIGGLGKLRFK
eukprot:gene1906-2249_t